MVTKSYTVTNTAKGIRGLNAVSGYVELDPGERREGVELSDAEYASAERTGYFEFGNAKAGSSADQEQEDALPGTHALLDKLAKDEGVTFPEGTRTVAEKQAAITAARDAAAADPGGAKPDELDNMSDDDLRSTAAALSGKSADEVASLDRDALLKLARGE